MRPSPFETFGRVSLAFLSLFMGLPYDVWAGPQGAQVVNGQVQFQNLGDHTNITASDRAIINFQSFNLSSSESVRFLQPHVNAWVLNRILASSRSEINGRVSANGGVVFVNPNGIYFGPNSTVDVNRLVASAHDISNESFLSNEWLFDSGQGDVIVDGEVRASNGAYFIGQHIMNNGSIFAPGGAVVMAAGDRVMLRDPGGSLMVEVDGKTVEDLRAAGASPDASIDGPKGTAIKNTGEIEAKSVSLFVGDMYSQAFELDRGRIASVTTDGSGRVEMIASSGSAAFGGTVEANGGRIDVVAPKVTTTGTLAARNGGRIAVEAGTDNIFRGATVDASSIGEKVGGFIELLGERVGLFDSTKVNASGEAGGGTVHVGGEFQGRGDTRQASQTSVGPGSEISVDALVNGDGGTAIVWAEGFTEFRGRLTSRGGSEGGDGGFAEISGKEDLVFAGSADLGAPNGSIGRILFDPTNITIFNGSGGNTLITDFDQFTENLGVPATFGNANITNDINGFITLQANNDITISNGANITVSGISLQAGRSVSIGGNIDAPFDLVSITANEDREDGLGNVIAVDAERGAGNATITVSNGVIINAGFITMRMDDGFAGTNVDSADITINGSLNATSFVSITNTASVFQSSTSGTGGIIGAGTITAPTVSLSVSTNAGGNIGTLADRLDINPQTGSANVGLTLNAAKGAVFVAVAGNATLNQSSSLGGNFDINLLNPSTTLAVRGSVTTGSGGDIRFAADNIDLSNVNAALKAGPGDIILKPKLAGANIHIGTSNGGGNFTINNTALSRLTSSGTVLIGQENGTGTGAVFVENVDISPVSNGFNSLTVSGGIVNIDNVVATGKTFNAVFSQLAVGNANNDLIAGAGTSLGFGFSANRQGDQILFTNNSTRTIDANTDMVVRRSATGSNVEFLFDNNEDGNANADLTLSFALSNITNLSLGSEPTGNITIDNSDTTVAALGTGFDLVTFLAGNNGANVTFNQKTVFNSLSVTADRDIILGSNTEIIDSFDAASGSLFFISQNPNTGKLLTGNISALTLTAALHITTDLQVNLTQDFDGGNLSNVGFSARSNGGGVFNARTITTNGGNVTLDFDQEIGSVVFIQGDITTDVTSSAFNNKAGDVLLETSGTAQVFSVLAGISDANVAGDITVVTGGAITFGKTDANGDITNAGDITGRVLDIVSGTSLTVHGKVAATRNITMDARAGGFSIDGTLTTDASDTSLGANDGRIRASGTQDGTFDGDITSSNFDININFSGGDVTVQAIKANRRFLTLNSGGDVTINGAITAGKVNITAVDDIVTVATSDATIVTPTAVTGDPATFGDITITSSAGSVVLGGQASDTADPQKPSRIGIHASGDIFITAGGGFLSTVKRNLSTDSVGSVDTPLDALGRDITLSSYQNLVIGADGGVNTNGGTSLSYFTLTFGEIDSTGTPFISQYYLPNKYSNFGMALGDVDVENITTPSLINLTVISTGLGGSPATYWGTSGATESLSNDVEDNVGFAGGEFSGVVYIVEGFTWKSLKVTGQKGVAILGDQSTFGGDIQLEAISGDVRTKTTDRRPFVTGDPDDFAVTKIDQSIVNPPDSFDAADAAAARSLFPTGKLVVKANSTSDVHSFQGSGGSDLRLGVIHAGGGFQLEAADRIILGAVDGEGTSNFSAFGSTFIGSNITDVVKVTFNSSTGSPGGTINIADSATAPLPLIINASGVIDATNVGAISLAGNLNWTTTAGSSNAIQLGGNATTLNIQADNVILNATGSGGSINVDSAVRFQLVGTGRTITLNQDADLTIGSTDVPTAVFAGFSSIYDLVANSSSGTVTVDQDFTWNTLTITAGSGVVVSGNQTTDSGGIRLTSTTGDITASGNLDSSLTLTLSTGSGNITARNLTATNIFVGDSGVTVNENTNSSPKDDTFSAAPDVAIKFLAGAILDARTAGDVQLLGSSLNAAGNLTIQNLDDIDFHIPGSVVVLGNFSISSTGEINASHPTSISASGNLSFTSASSAVGGTGPAAIDLNDNAINANINTIVADNIFLTTTHQNGVIEVNNATLEVNAVGGDVIITTETKQTYGAGGFLFTGTTSDIDLFSVVNGINPNTNISFANESDLTLRSISVTNKSSGGQILLGTNVDLIATTAIALLASNGSVNADATSRLQVQADGGDISVTQFGAVTIGGATPSFTLGGDASFVDLTVVSTGNGILFGTNLTVNSLTATAATGANEANGDAIRVADTVDIISESSIVMQATAGNIDIGQDSNGDITATTDITLTASNGIIEGSGGLNVGAAKTLTLTQGSGDLTIGSGGVTNISSTNLNLVANATGGEVFFSDSNLDTFNSITATASIGLTTTVDLTANVGPISLSTTGTGSNINVGGNLTGAGVSVKPTRDLIFTVPSVTVDGNDGAVSLGESGVVNGRIITAGNLTITDASTVSFTNSSSITIGSNGKFDISSDVTGAITASSVSDIILGNANSDLIWAPTGNISAPSSITGQGGEIRLIPGNGKDLSFVTGSISAGGGNVTLGENGVLAGALTATNGLLIQNAKNVLIQNSGGLTVSGADFSITAGGNIDVSAADVITLSGASSISLISTDATAANGVGRIAVADVTTGGGNIILRPANGEDLNVLGKKGQFSANGTGQVTLGAAAQGGNIDATRKGLEILSASNVSFINTGGININNGDFKVNSSINGTILSNAQANLNTNALNWNTSGTGITLTGNVTNAKAITLSTTSGNVASSSGGVLSLSREGTITVRQSGELTVGDDFKIGGTTTFVDLVVESINNQVIFDLNATQQFGSIDADGGLGLQILSGTFMSTVDGDLSLTTTGGSILADDNSSLSSSNDMTLIAAEDVVTGGANLSVGNNQNLRITRNDPNSPLVIGAAGVGDILNSQNVSLTLAAVGGIEFATNSNGATTLNLRSLSATASNGDIEATIDIVGGPGSVTLITTGPNTDIMIQNLTGDGITVTPASDLIITGGNIDGEGNDILLGSTGANDIIGTASGINITDANSVTFQNAGGDIQIDNGRFFVDSSFDITANLNVVDTNGNAIEFRTASGDLALSGTQVTDASNITFFAPQGGVTSGAIDIQNDADSVSITVQGDLLFNNTFSAEAALSLNSTAGSLTLGRDSIYHSLNLTAATDIIMNANLTTQTAGAFFTADGDINLNGALTTNSSAGATIIADAEGNGSGDLTIALNGRINTNNEALRITANDIILQGVGGVRLNAGTNDITITPSDNADIGLGAAAGGLSLSNSEITLITANNLILQTSGGATIQGTTNANPNIATTSVSSGNISIAAASIFTNSLALRAVNDITLSGNLTSANASLTLDADTDVNGSGGINLNGPIALAAGTNITLSDNVASTATGTFTATAGGVFSAQSITLDVAGQAVGLRISAGDVILGGNIVTNDTVATVSFLPANDRTVEVGFDSNAATNTEFSIDDTELGRIAGINGPLTIGSAAITVSNEFVVRSAAFATGTNVTLNTGQLFRVNSGTTSFDRSLTLNSVGGNVDDSAIISISGTTIANTDSGALALGNNASLTLGGNLTLTTNDLNLGTNTTINAGTNDISIAVSNVNNTIGLGGNSITNTAAFSILASELQAITADQLTLSGSNSTTTVFAIAGAESNNVASVILDSTNAGANISFNGNATFNQLTANTNDVISISVSLTTDVGAISIRANDIDIDDALGSLNSAGVASITHADTTGGTNLKMGAGANSTLDPSDGLDLDNGELNNITSNGLVVITAGEVIVDNIAAGNTTGITGSFNITSGQNVTFRQAITFRDGLEVLADDGITITGNLTANGTPSANNSRLLLNADADDTGSGALIANNNATITSNNQILSIAAADVNLDTATNTDSGTAVTIFTATGGVEVGVGDANAPLRFSSAELAKIFSTGLNISTTSSNITVDNVSGGVNGPLTLDAGASVIFNGAASSFTDTLTVEADNDIIFNVDLNTTADLTLIADGERNANGDLASNGVGDLILANGARIDANDQTILITANDLNMNATGEIFSRNGNITITKSDSVGTFILGDGAGGAFTFSRIELQNMESNDLTLVTTGDVSVGNITITESGDIDGTLTIRGQNVLFTGGDTTVHTLAVNANGDINVTVNVSTDLGGITLDAVGVVNVDNAQTVNSNNQVLAIRADDLILNGNLASGTNATTITDADNSGVRLGASAVAGQLNISGAEIGRISATGLNITTADRIRVEGITAAQSNNIGGNFTLISTGEEITFDAGASTFNSLVVRAALNVLLEGNVITGVGDASITSLQGLVRVEDGSTLNSGAANISITANDLDLEGTGALSAGGTITITEINGDGIGLGNTVPAGGLRISTGINGEADSITTTGGLILASNGNIIVNNVTLADTAGLAAAASLVTNADVFFQGSNASFTSGLNVQAVGNVTVNPGITVSSNNSDATIAANDLILNGILNAGTNNITLSDIDGSGAGVGNATVINGFNVSNNELSRIFAKELTITSESIVTVDGVQAGSVGNISSVFRLNANSTDSNNDATVTFSNSDSTFTQALDIRADDGINISVNVTSQTGGITLNADQDTDANAGVLTINGSVTSTNSDISITTNDLVLVGSINSGNADITIADSSGGGIGVGNAEIPGGLNISRTELRNFFADDLTISSSGNVSIDAIAPTDSGNVTGTLTIAANRSITFGENASTFSGLIARADDGIIIRSNVTTTVNDLDLDGDADNNADTNDNIVFAAGITVQSGDKLILAANNGDLRSATGTLTLIADNGIDISDALSVNGDLTIDADFDNNSNGDLVISGAVFTNNSDISITADDLVLTAALNAGTADISIANGNADVSFALGSTVGNFNISDVEGGLITANVTTIGSATAGNIAIDSFSPDNITTLILRTNAGVIEGTPDAGSDLRITNLGIQAVNGVDIDIDVTNVAISNASNGDIDIQSLGGGINVDTVGGINGITNSSGGDITITASGNNATTDDIAINQAITAAANGDITISASSDIFQADNVAVTAGGTGSVIFSASTNTAGGVVTHQGSNASIVAGTNITVTTDGNITLADLITNGSLNISTANGDVVFLNGGNISADDGVTIQAGNGLTLDVPITTVNGDILLNGDSDTDGSGNLTTGANATLTTGTGDVFLIGDDIRLGANVTAIGNISIVTTNTGGVLTVATGTTTNSENGDIAITINGITLDGSMNAGTRNITINQKKAAFADTSLGDFGTNIDLHLDNSELSRITANVLEINGTDAISVSNVSAASSGNITLVRLNTSDVRFTDGSSTFNALEVSADDDVDVFFSVTTTSGDLSLTAVGTGANDGLINMANGDLVLQSATNLRIQNEGGINGTNSTLTFIAQDDISISGGNISSVGRTVITADNSGNGNGDFSLIGNINFTTANNSLNITANDIDLGVNVTINTANADIFVNDSDGTGIGLGNVTLAGGLILSGGELQSFTTAGNLTLNTVGNIVVNTISETNSDNVANVILSAGGNTSFGEAASTFNAIDVRANNGIVMSVSLTTDGGALSLDGDADSANNGAIQIAAGIVLSSVGALTLDADNGDIAAAGNLTLTSTAGAILIDDALTVGGALSTAANTTITANEAINVTGNFAASATNGDITANGNVAGANTTLVAGSGAILLGGTLTATGTLVAIADNGFTANGDITSNGATTINADNDATGGGTLVLAANVDLVTTNNILAIIADDIAIGTNATINTGTADIAISDSDNTGIGLGGTNVAGGITITDTEFGGITANNISLNTNGNVIINGITDTNSRGIANTLDINVGSSSNVTFTTTASSINATLDVVAPGAISVGVDVAATNGDLIFNSTGATTFAANVTVAASETMTLTAGGNLTGVGSLDLDARDGITINDDITTNGFTDINADTDAVGAGTFTLNNAVLTTQNNPLTLTLTDLVLIPNSRINVGNATFTVNETQGNGFGIGEATVAGGINITGAELQSIFAAANVTFNTAGVIAVNNVTAANSNNIGILSLLAGGNISFTNNSTFNALNANADNGIIINTAGSTLAADTGALAFDGDADNSTVGGNQTNNAIAIAAGVTLSSNTTLTLDATNGNMAAVGNLTLNANAGITINDSLTTNGDTILDADVNNNASGTLSLAANAALSTTNNRLDIDADDIVIDATASINAGTADITIDDTDVTGIGLGGTGVGLDLSDVEFGRITGRNLTLNTAGNVVVNGITPANSNNLSGTVLVDATGNITFATAASTFNTLDAQSDNIITVNVGLAADTGLLSLSGDIDGNSSINADNIQFGAGVTASANTTMTLTSGNGDITGAGSLILNANSGITVNDSLTTNGLATINSDVDGNGNADANGFGNLNLAANTTLSTTNGDLTITTNDLVTSNTTINAGTGNILITDSDGSGLEFGAAAGGNNLNISDVELGLMTASNLTINTNGNAVVENISAANSNNIAVTTALNANGSITFQAGDSTFNALAAQGATGITASVNITADTGRLTLNTTAANSDITVVNLTSTGDMNVDPERNLIINGTTLTASSNGDILIGENTAGTNGNITANSSLDIRSAGNVTLRNSGTVSVAGGNFTINNGITGNIDVGASTGISLTNATSVLTFSGTGEIIVTDISTTQGDIILTPGANQDVTFADPDADGVTINAQGSANITIGENSAGNGDVIANATLDIRNAVNVTFQSSGNITVNNGGFTINTGITGAIDTSTIANGISVTQASADLSFIAGDDIRLASVTTNAGDITATPGAGDNLIITGGLLNSTGGNVTLGESGVGNGVITATAAGLNILSPNNVLLANSGNVNVNTGGFFISSGTGDIDASAVSAIAVGSNLSLNWASNTANGNVDYGAAVITAGDITINLSGNNSTIEETTGTLAVTQEGGNVNITTGAAHTFGNGTDEIAFAGTLGFIDLTANSSSSTVTIEDNAFTGGSALNSLNVTGNTGVNISVNLETDANGSSILITATTGEIAGGSRSITANNGTLTLNAAQAGQATSNVTIGNLTGIGVSVNAGGNGGGTITLSSTVNALDNNVDMTANLLNATTNGLNVFNSNNVTFDIGATMTVSGGDFTIDNDITGRIDVGANASINVQGTNNLSFGTNSTNGIDYGVANINANNITLTLSNANATIQESTGTLAVNSDGGDVNISVQGSQTFGANANEIAFAGTTTFIDLRVNAGANIAFEDTALTGANGLNTITANAQNDINSSVNLQTDGSLLLTATGDVNAAGQTFTAAGALALSAGDDIQANNLIGQGVTVQAVDDFTVNSITGGGLAVNIASQDMLAAGAGLTISNANNVTLAVADNITVNNGSLFINTNITGAINTSTADNITVAAGNVTMQTTGIAGINYGGADITGNDIILTASNGAIIQNANGSLAVNANGGDIQLSQNASLSIGTTAGTIRLAGTTTDIDLQATSSGTVTLASSLNLNSENVTGASVAVNGAQTTDTGAVNIQASSGDITGENTSITAQTSLTMQAAGGISTDDTAMIASNGNVNLTASTGVVTGNVNAGNGDVTIIANQGNVNGAFTRAIASGGAALIDDIVARAITVIANNLTTGSVSGTTIALTASSNGTLSLGSNLISSVGSILLNGGSVSGSGLSFTSADDLNFNSISTLTNSGNLTFNVTNDILATFLNLNTTGTSSLSAQTISNLGTTIGSQGLTFDVNRTTGFTRTGETVFNAGTGQLTLIGFYNIIGDLFVNGATFDFTRATFGAQTGLKFIPAQEVEGTGVVATTVSLDTKAPTAIFFEVEPDITDFEIEETPIRATNRPSVRSIKEFLAEVFQLEGLEIDEDAVQLDFFPPILVGDAVVDSASEVSIGSPIEQLTNEMRTLMDSLNSVQRLTTLADQIQENQDQFNALMISDPWIRDARRFITLSPLFLLKAGLSTSYTRSTLMKLIEPLRDTHARAYELLLNMIDEETADTGDKEEEK